MSGSVLTDALAYLTDLVADEAQPAEAHARLEALNARHPDSRLRLLWQREAYDGSLQYDLLIGRRPGGTVSLSWCPDASLPWPLRGGQREEDSILLRVNGEPLELDQAIACLDFIWDDATLTERLVNTCLLRQELAEHPVKLGDRELQEAVDGFRRARGLLSAAATRDWLQRHCLAHGDLEAMAAEEATVARLRETTTRGRVPAYFAEHRRGLDKARMVRVLFRSRADAQRAIDDAAGGDFYAVAEQSFAEGRAVAGAMYVTARRDELDPELADAVLDAPLGATLGPFASGDGYAVVRLLAVEQAVLDTDTMELIERRLFETALAHRRRTARVEWCWGNAGRTDPDGSTGTT